MEIYMPDIKLLDIAKVKKLRDSNNVEIVFFENTGKLSASKIIGRKQLVERLDRLVERLSKTSHYPGLLAAAKEKAAQFREHLWPKPL